MGISLSGGDYQYNRFDAYEKALEEGRGAGSPEEMKKKVDKAGKKSKKSGRLLSHEDEKEEGEEEVSQFAALSKDLFKLGVFTNDEEEDE